MCSSQVYIHCWVWKCVWGCVWKKGVKLFNIFNVLTNWAKVKISYRVILCMLYTVYILCISIIIKDWCWVSINEHVGNVRTLIYTCPYQAALWIQSILNLTWSNVKTWSYFGLLLLISWLANYEALGLRSRLHWFVKSCPRATYNLSTRSTYRSTQ